MQIFTRILPVAAAIVTAIGQHSIVEARGSDSKKTLSKKSILYIDNENTKELGILIKPEIMEDHTIDDRKRLVDNRLGRWLTFALPASSIIEINIPQNELGEDIDRFSVTGETNPITPIGRCYNLQMGKNYFLRFTDNAAGTDCISKEVGDKPPLAKGERIKVPFSRSNLHHATDVEFSPTRASQSTTK